MVRATTGGVMRSYRSNLMKSFIADNKARETVLTQRVFNSYAEDPAAAAKTFRLRKSRLMTSSQLKICDDTLHKYQGAFASLQTVSQLIDTENKSSDLSSLKNTTLRMLNDPTGDARTQLNKVLDNLSDTIIQNMNQTYGDEFIFAGADGYNVPFEVREEDGHKNLYYRGISVDAAEPELVKDANGAPIECDANGVPTENGDYYLKPENISVVEAPPENLQNVNLVRGNGPNDYFIYPSSPPPAPFDGIVRVQIYDANGQAVKVNPGDPTPDLDASPDLYYVAYGADPTESAPGFAETVSQDHLIPFSKYKEWDDENGGPGMVGTIKIDLNLPNDIVKDSNGDPVVVQGPNATQDNSGIATQADTKYYLKMTGDAQVISKKDYDKACQNVEKLDYLAKEKRFVDIGLGFKEDEKGNLIESSAFNECISGLTFLGYGMDEDGDPKNIYSLVQRLKEIAASVPEEGKWDDDTYNEFDRLVGKLEDASSEFKTQFTNHSAGVQKLENNYDLLEENVDSLKVQYSNLEDVNMADAISSFIWAEYCYNAALKVGNSILSQSLMDYLQ